MDLLGTAYLSIYILTLHVYFFFSLPMIPIHHMQAHALTARLLEQ